MQKHRFKIDYTKDRAGIAPNASRLKIIELAGGDPAFGDMLREMIWQSYCDADQPFGPTEEGMFIWLEHQQQTVG